jgi:RND family efflux transporter MFP subunit
MIRESSFLAYGAVFVAGMAAACSPPRDDTRRGTPDRVAGSVYTVRDTTIEATLEATGVASPVRQAILSTKLMGTVTAVLASEGDAVTTGRILVRIDARDLSAKSAQVAAAVSDAESMYLDAETRARRIRALYADSAAAKAQLDAAETGFARAGAGLRAARASAAELSAMSAYASVRAPFGGVVTKRFVDPGSFAAPGAPLVEVQDASRLRISVSASPDAVRGIRRGQFVSATIEGRPVRAAIEGVVPTAVGNLYTVNALLPNPGGVFLPGSAATISLSQGTRSSIVVPITAVIREGDLTGVTLRTEDGDQLRWIRLGAAAGGVVEVTAGLRAGDRVLVPPALASATAPGRN